MGHAQTLEQGAEIAVLGGGVAGCAFAIGVLASAQLRGLRLDVRVFDPPESAAAQPPVVVGPVARHRLAALGVGLLPQSCAVELAGIVVWSEGESELIALAPGTAWVIDGWPAQPAGSVLLERQLQQAAALRGARFVPRPLEQVERSGEMLALRAGGRPERARVLAVARSSALTGVRSPPRCDAVFARLFASARAASELGAMVRVFFRPTPQVELLAAIPGVGSLHLSAYGRRVGATELALALAELRRQRALPDGLEIAELSRSRASWGLAPRPRESRILTLGDAGAAFPLDPLGPSLEQGQRAALAVAESARDLDELASRSAGLLSGPREDVRSAVKALARAFRAGSAAPRALSNPSISAVGSGLLFGLGPLPYDARERLLGPSLWGPWVRLWREEGPGRPARAQTARPVLVVEDDPSQRAALCAFLSSRHLPVRAVSDEMSLLAAAAEEPPRAVVLDVVLDWIDGLRLCRSLRAHPATRHTPVFVMSGLSRASDRRAALSAGATGFFPKPLDLDALVSHLERLGCG